MSSELSRWVLSSWVPLCEECVRGIQLQDPGRLVIRGERQRDVGALVYDHVPVPIRGDVYMHEPKRSWLPCHGPSIADQRKDTGITHSE